jgi:putative transposase
MIDRAHALPVVQQCQLLAIARSSVYAVPRPIATATLALMRQMDELHLQHPFAGSRMLRDLLRLHGVTVGRKHVATLLHRMGIAALSQRPRTTRPHPGPSGVSVPALGAHDHGPESGVGHGHQCAAVKHRRR